MLTQQTITKLKGLRLAGMAKGFEDQLTSAAALSSGSRIASDFLWIRKSPSEKIIALSGCSRLQSSKPTLEDVDYRHHRGLDKSQIASLATCQWIQSGL